jgi:hypothetical protein
VTTVTYTVTDASGNTASCSFTVTVIDNQPPAITCPASVTIDCDASALPANTGTATATDNCSPSPVITYTDAITPGSCPGNYVIARTWAATDASGNSTLCIQNIMVHDVTAPVITSCPSNVNSLADPGQPFATISLPPPLTSDNCTATANISIAWTMSAPTAGSGTGTIAVPFHFNIGATTVSYTFTDACGNSANCSFTVTVTPNYPPEINCPSNISHATDPGQCSAALDPGFPSLVSGTPPISYSWVMTGANTGSGNGAIVPNPCTFNKGTTTITWRATNIAGFDECTQTITVADNQPPVFTAPLPRTFCVENITTATYWDPTMDIAPNRPDYYVFNAGDTDFNLDPGTFADNCPLNCGAEIRWRIDFADGTSLPVLPALYITGQPSAYGTDIQLPGSVTGDVTHTITYRIADCNGNTSLPVTVNILIKPRPDIIKQP